MPLLLITAIMFALIGLVLSTSRDVDLARLGVVMLVSGFIFAGIVYVIRVGP